MDGWRPLKVFCIWSDSIARHHSLGANLDKKIIHFMSAGSSYLGQNLLASVASPVTDHVNGGICSMMRMLSKYVRTYGGHFISFPLWEKHISRATARTRD